MQVGVVGALSAFYRDAADVNDSQQRDMAVLRIIAKMPTLAAIAYKTAIGVTFTMSGQCRVDVLDISNIVSSVTVMLNMCCHVVQGIPSCES
jgi:citrate synthase